MQPSWIGLIVIGIIAGWLTGKIVRGAGYGVLGDLLLGLVGAVIGGWIFTQLGILAHGLLVGLAAATLGAVLLVTVARLFRV
jgi:uncharacterized membrane protein YeaQ/YmgE (transglycosylase-associated protein family)